MSKKQNLSLTFIVFGGSIRRQVQELVLAKDDIYVGRSNSSRLENGLDLDLKHDLCVSQKHARILKSGPKLFIEDLGSEAGTLVDGQEIKGQGAVEIRPSTTVKTGNTTWTVIPADWLLIRRGEVIVSAPCAKGINYALYHCGTPIVGPVTAKNFGRQKSTALPLRLQVTGYSDPCEIKVPALEPGSQAFLGMPGIRLHAAILRLQTVPVRTQLTVEVDGRPDTAAAKNVTVLSFWAWSYDRSARKTIAAFVSPRNPVIDRIVLQTQANMKAKAVVHSFFSLLRSGRENAEWKVLERLYRYLKERCVIHYERPDSQGCHQIVRPPHRIFPPDSPTPEGKATCLDLALLMAGCLEIVGLCPLVIFTSNEEDIPRHALVGCWAGSTPGGRPVIYDRELLQREFKLKNLLVVECTGLAEGANPQRGKLAFNEAVEAGIKQLMTASWICAVDIGALRPPFGLITPIDCPVEPEVAGAYDEARRFAKLKRREVIETNFLFYGCLTVNGEITRWLFEAAGIDLNYIRDGIQKLVKPRFFFGEPSPSRNYIDCCRVAEDIAWRAGSPSVREQDLLWAILKKGPDSTKFRDTCRKLKLALNLLINFLNKRYPCPETSVTFYSLASGAQE